MFISFMMCEQYARAIWIILFYRDIFFFLKTCWCTKIPGFLQNLNLSLISFTLIRPFFSEFLFLDIVCSSVNSITDISSFSKKKREDGLVECTLLNTLDIESLPTYSNHLPIIENQIGSSIHLQPTLNISALVNSTFSETKKRELISPQNVKAHI